MVRLHKGQADTGPIRLTASTLKGVVHFLKKTFADNLLALMSSKMSMSFFLQLK